MTLSMEQLEAVELFKRKLKWPLNNQQATLVVLEDDRTGEPTGALVWDPVEEEYVTLTPIEMGLMLAQSAQGARRDLMWWLR